MLITKEMSVKWNKNNKKRFIELGHTFTNYDDKFMVNVEDLSIHAPYLVEVTCDYCQDIGIHTVVSKQWCNYLKERRNVQKDTCNICKYKKYKDVLAFKQKSNILTKEDKGYWTFKENRLKALDEFIKINGTISKMDNYQDGCSLYSTILKFKETPYELSLELGYNINEIMDIKPNGYYNDFNIFKNDIEKLISKYGRFPTSIEIKQNLTIDYKYIQKFGGMYGLKRKMNYDGSNDLIDNNNFYNNSTYELFSANFLIFNNVPYLRERKPFKDENYRSDFMLSIIKENGELQELHVEVWGYEDHNNKSMFGESYMKVREIKEALYKKNHVDYISIEPSVFLHKKYSQIQESLYNIFKPYLNLEFKHIEQEKFLSFKSLSDEELMIEVLKYSNNNEYLPYALYLRTENHSLYQEVLKRFKNYTEFAEKFGKLTLVKSNGYWDKEKIFNIFEHMLSKYNKILNRNEINKLKYTDILIDDISHIISSLNRKDKYGGIFELKIEFFYNCHQNNIVIPKSEIKWLINISKNVTRRGNKLVSYEYSEFAKLILEKYNDNDIKDSIIDSESELEITIFNSFNHMISKYGHILSINEYHEFKKTDSDLNVNIYKRITRSSRDINTYKLMYFQHCVDDNKLIPNQEIEWLFEVSCGRSRNQYKPTPEHQLLAKQILDKYNNNLQLSAK